MDVFEKARLQAKIDYEINKKEKTDRAEIHLEWALDEIDKLEKAAQKNIFTEIKYTCIMHWKILSEEAKQSLGIAIFLLSLVLFVLEHFEDLSFKEWTFLFIESVSTLALWIFALMTIDFISAIVKRNIKSYSITFWGWWIATFILCIPYAIELFGLC